MNNQNFKEDRMGDAVTTVQKIGLMHRSKELRKLYEIRDFIESSIETDELLYDVYYDGKPELKSISYTEFLTSSLFVTACCDDLRFKAAKDAANDHKSVTRDRCQELKDSGKSRDKYRLRKALGISEYDAVIMTTGSNIFDQVMDLEKMDRVMEKGRVIIKPHPLLNNHYLEPLIKRYGKNKVADPKSSGYQLLQASETVYTTHASEMAMYAIINNKKLRSIAKWDAPKRPIYSGMFEQIIGASDPYETLNRILNSPKSGVLFLDDYQQKLPAWMEYITEAACELAS